MSTTFSFKSTENNDDVYKSLTLSQGGEGGGAF